MRSVQNTTENVFKLIGLFNTGRSVVIKDIQTELELKSWSSAKRYLDAACLYLPIYESGFRKSNTNTATVYKLIR